MKEENRKEYKRMFRKMGIGRRAIVMRFFLISA